MTKIPPKWSSRTIDIDIIFYDDLILNEPDLTIPHKYMHQRAFVLVPLLELIADYKHPKFNITLEEMYYNLETLEDVYLYGTRYTSPN
ncbi:MAG: 2-amino-4-hydroxy-6-hydroxymethyldihydropteridine diphosphokinase [Candidatus Melainabacteria bacterium]|nr:MAG: 2-amino-4-hydroxy-6-hydroxymethyldihydropteridine diphosphokinase [Candidatus Melainabacteria bacterium]